MNSDHQIILEFMKEHLICVVSTLNADSTIESAAVAFTELDDLQIAIQTPNTTRKYANLKQNPTISLVIGWNPENMKTIQYQGEAHEATESEKEIIQIRQIQKNPASKKYAYLPDNKYFLIKPNWIRYSDLSKNPQEVFEVNLTK